MKTLVIGKIWPEPVSSAAGTRTMNLLLALQEAGWETTFATTAQASEYSVDVEGMGISSCRIAVNDSSFDGWVSDLGPDLVIFDRYMIEEQFGWRVEKACPAALRVLDTSDLHCLREARGVQLKQGGELNLYNEVALREVASIHRCDLTFMISEFEMGVLQEVFQIPERQLAYLPFMIDLLDAPLRGYEEREHFVMIGSYMHEPNWDAVRWCCESIWPAIRAALPEAELHVYGSYEPPKARQLNNSKKGIVISGRAENAIETVGQYRVNLAPLRFGAGQKGKLADGFVAGTPGVATPVAAESMNGDIDWGCAIESESEAFARVAVEVYSDSDVWTKVQRQGTLIAKERFSAMKWKKAFVERLDLLAKDAAVNRHRNFVGRMLRHHQHRSTEFMSRWIEAKNRIG